MSLEFLIHKAEKKVVVEFRPVRKVASLPFHPHFLSSVPRLCCCWEISYNSRKTVSHGNRHGNSALNEKWVKIEIKKELKDFLELNENEYITYTNI